MVWSRGMIHETPLYHVRGFAFAGLLHLLPVPLRFVILGHVLWDSLGRVGAYFFVAMTFGA